MHTLVLGGTGMLGHKLFQHLSARLPDVHCTIRAPQGSAYAKLPLFAGPNIWWGLDAGEWRSLEALLRHHRPAVVVNAIGVIKQRAASHDAVPSIRINALLPHLLASTLREWNGRLIHFSSDCVFSGRDGAYREDDAPDAEDLYGRSKHLGEIRDSAAVLTLRTSMIGRELTHHQSLLDWFLSQDGGQVSGYRRVIYSGLTTIELARVTESVIVHHPELSGLYHVTAPPISKHDLLALVAERFALKVRIVPTDEPVSDRSLDGGRFAAATGYLSPTWPQLIAAIADDPTPYAEWATLLHD